MEGVSATKTSAAAPGVAAAAARGDRWLQPGHRGAQAQRDRHDLRAAGHSDHRPHAQAPARGPARHLLPPRAERGLRRVDRGLHDAEAGHLPHRVRPRLPQRVDRAGACDDQLLSDDPDQRLLGARDRRPFAGRLRGDGPARDRQAAVQGGVPRPARGGHRRRRRARDPCGGLGPPGRRLSRSARQAVPADDGRRSGSQVPHQGRRCGAEADSRARIRRSARSIS